MQYWLTAGVIAGMLLGVDPTESVWRMKNRIKPSASVNRQQRIDPRTMTTEEFFLACRDIVKAFAVRVVSDWNKNHSCKLNEEFTQNLQAEVFCRLPAAREQFRGESLFTTYLFRIVENTMMSMMRKEMRARGIGPRTRGDGASPTPQTAFAGDAIDSLPDTRSSLRAELPAELIEALEAIASVYHTRDNPPPLGREAAAVIEEGLAQMKKTRKIVIGKMYFIDGCPQTVIAASIGRAQSTVSEHIEHIRKHLLTYIRGRFPETAPFIAELKRRGETDRLGRKS